MTTPEKNRFTDHASIHSLGANEEQIARALHAHVREIAALRLTLAEAEESAKTGMFDMLNDVVRHFQRTSKPLVSRSMK